MKTTAFSEWLHREKDACAKMANRRLQRMLNDLALSERPATARPSSAGEILEIEGFDPEGSMAAALRHMLQKPRLSRTHAVHRVLDAEWVEAHEGDLDEAYERDRLEGLHGRLTYTREEAKAGIAPRHKVPVAMGLVGGTEALRVAVSLYRTFRDDEAGLPTGELGTRWVSGSADALFRYVWDSESGKVDG